ncbi:SGNH/GDSL hydrolase family protein [Lacihabitans sp. LS3-19]|uniref:SGNH/GDSL hydrolase family protein n=1 Tax=Lacihabitans sp. LS3-19 TaxID=2487335 RepID=UPI0020CF10F7|nr:SGNH/GDSL hydrolase family protein [Lacihabitans sp. LS3-19]MCP9767848.1 SGNH/GDSL hydrolase family protein [Lacihabitans sp. LS3-19]
MHNSRRKFLKQSLQGLTMALLPKIAFSKSGLELPKILIIGDSISIGYTPFVQEILIGKAMVSRPMNENGVAENCEGTSNGILKIDAWIGNTKWDLIHFNFGLHDLKHVKPDTGENSNNPDDPLQVEKKQYRKNLKEIVAKLKATNAKLIFATTTPYPDGELKPLRDPGMSAEYNAIALKIMKANNIPVNDLYAFVLPRLGELQRPMNVHFTDEGSHELAKQCVKSIEQVLALK